jgi:methionyl-tRNA synthetase
VKRFYITTPIYYVTAKPHLGSLYSTLIADVLARYQRLQGRDTYLLTGTDEHGQKVAQAAAQANMPPQEFVDSFIPAYTSCWRQYGIDYDQFIRTTGTNHVARAQAFVSKLQDAGYIYKAAYEGWYCTPCETFITEKDIVSKDAPSCPSCSRQTVWLSEDTYYFKLSAFQEPLLKFYEQNPHFIVPKERQNEVKNFVESGLKDLSISRTTVPWGVPFPHDPKHTIYVWVEALCNYITAVGYPNDMPQFNVVWPVDVQVLGKDIVRFHAVYWPALLMAAGLEVPKKLLVHGWITVDHQKMSKSLGNVVDPVELQVQYGADPVRYYLMKHMPITHDGNFSIADLEQTITADLANTLGNLFNRASVLAQTISQGTVKMPAQFSADAQKVRDAEQLCIDEYQTYMSQGVVHLALQAVQTYLHTLNQYFHATAPWKLAKTDLQAALEVLAVIARGLHAAALVLWPVMPQVMVQLLNALHVDTSNADTLRLDTFAKSVPAQYSFAVIPPLFIKPEPTKNKTEVKPVETKSAVESIGIGIEDFLKVQLAVGTITSAEAVEKSDKLIKLTVDFGTHGTRQILSGLRLHHTAESLVGLQAVFVLNLKPRMMMGLESHGMLLTAADANGVPQPIKPVAAVGNGTVLK